ncbi:hypothetical protein Rleg_3134 [Rhizobium leguminosarum bv. trifolii WSM1325]|uniref:Uncharacterized protein n=1 Tax=Rhizobium leguminosarum bv. trifolii (strain WSM1325) TaxID=395491 RepID=C6ATP7_RHILS|nr:hypothetical protein Rleg_3134 [Rhizobium leguminosarum bv. trifolii WSM1325]
MKIIHVSASHPPHPAAATFSPLGRSDCRAVSFPPSLLGEKVPEGRMRGPRGTTHPREGGHR